MKYIQDVLQQSAHSCDHFKSVNCCPLSCKQCLLPHGPTTSMTHTSTVSRPICPIFRSVYALPLVYPANTQSRESDYRNDASEPPFIESPYDCSMPSPVPVSTPISLPCNTSDHRRCSYQSRHPVCDSDHGIHDSDPISIAMPLPGDATRSPPP